MFLLFTSFGFGQFNYHLQSRQITPNTRCFFGLHGEASEINGANVINTCYIQTKEGYIVIDSGPTYSYAQQAHQIMQKAKALPIKYVINTSSNELNILGNEFYRERGAVLIGPKNYKKYVKQSKNISIQKQISSEAFENTRLIPLHIPLNKNKTIHIGDTKIEIKKLESKEARNLLVYLPESKTIFTGNFISDKPSVTQKEHYSKKEWAKNFNIIEKLSSEYIITSHGVKRSKKALALTKDYLKLFQKKIESKKNKIMLAQKQETIKKKVIQKKEVVKVIKKEVSTPKKVAQKKHIPCIQYTNFNKAKKSAIKEHKYVIIKYESDNCRPCDELNKVLRNNGNVKKMVNTYTKAVKINRDHNDETTDYDLMLTPTIILVDPITKRTLVKLVGRAASEDLEDSLKLYLNKAHTKSGFVALR